MSFAALKALFEDEQELPIPVDLVLTRIRETSEFDQLTLHAVNREHKSYRGAFRRIPMATRPYGHDPELWGQVIYGADLPRDWQRLVIIKEALHVYDPPQSRVVDQDVLRRLIPAVIAREVQALQPVLNDQVGPYKAMAIMIPEVARVKLAAAVASGTRTVEEIADYVELPLQFVDIWLRMAPDFDPIINSQF